MLATSHSVPAEGSPTPAPVHPAPAMSARAGMWGIGWTAGALVALLSYVSGPAEFSWPTQLIVMALLGSVAFGFPVFMNGRRAGRSYGVSEAVAWTVIFWLTATAVTWALRPGATSVVLVGLVGLGMACALASTVLAGLAPRATLQVSRAVPFGLAIAVGVGVGPIVVALPGYVLMSVAPDPVIPVALLAPVLAAGIIAGFVIEAARSRFLDDDAAIHGIVSSVLHG